MCGGGKSNSRCIRFPTLPPFPQDPPPPGTLSGWEGYLPWRLYDRMAVEPCLFDGLSFVLTLVYALKRAGIEKMWKVPRDSNNPP
jgi:hypothetical protein